MSALSIEGEARLDNRAELLGALGIEPREGPRVLDLELILRAFARWGESCPEKLLGDFAFVVRDDRAGSAFGARDHLGVKPFTYRCTQGRLAFATRAAAIPGIDGGPLEIDEARLADVLVPELEGLDATSTLYRGILRLPPGHRIACDGGRVETAPYWRLDPTREVRFASDADYVEAFREVFAEAVRCRLSGEAASMLSGGLDSSAIVGFARASRLEEGGPPLLTLSAVTDDPGCEESRHARAVSRLSGLDPVAIRPEDLPAFAREIETLAGSGVEPFDAAMIVPSLMYAAARRRGCEAVLDGVDGDVVASHEPDLLASLLRSGHWGAAARLAAGFAGFYRGTYAPWSSAPRLLAANALRAGAPGLARAGWRRLRRGRRIEDALRGSLVRRDFAASVDLAGRLETLADHRRDLARRSPRERQAAEIGHPQIVAALERYHRVAAAAGIEARHPFFDKRVVELALALPWDQKVRDGFSKHVVREAVRGLIPDEVRLRRGRWVRLGPRFLAAAIAASGDRFAQETAAGWPEIAAYVDLGKLRNASGEAVWTAAILSSWLRETRSRRYDPPRSASGPAQVLRVPVAG